MNLAYLLTSSLGLLGLGLVVSCGSYETVDSKDVPLKQRPGAAPGTLPEVLPVQDIHQHYSLVYSAAADTTHVFAQFRVRDRFGTTIRFGHSDRVQFADSNMRLVDGTIYGPILTLFQGTFYSLTRSGPVHGPFRFTDDWGNTATMAARVPELTVTATDLVTADGFEATRPQTYTIKYAVDPTAAHPSILCSLRTRAQDSLDQDAQASSSTSGVMTQDGNGTCTFAQADVTRHMTIRGSTELEVELTSQVLTRDPWDRVQQLTLRHIKTQKINRGPETKSLGHQFLR